MAKQPAASEGEAPKKKGKLMIIILAVVGLVVVLALALAAWLLLAPADPGKQAETAAEGEAAPVDEGAPPIYERLEQFTVNLADQQTLLQTEIQLIVASPEVQRRLQMRMPEVRDAMIRLLSSKLPEDLSLPDGKTRLADEIRAELNTLLGLREANGIRRVLFGSFIIQ